LQLSKLLEKAESKIKALYDKFNPQLPRYATFVFLVLFAAGFVIHSVTTGLNNFWMGRNEPLFTINPFENIAAVFSQSGIGVIIFSVLMYCLFTKKGFSVISGYRTVKDKERGIEILPEGTHGTSGFMDKKELPEFLKHGSIESLEATLFGKLKNGDYVAMKELSGMSKNIIVYGAPGTGKSRGFVMPFAMQAARRGESLIMVDPKAGATRS